MKIRAKKNMLPTILIPLGMVLALLAGLLASVSVTPVLAATITVTNLDPYGPGSLYNAVWGGAPGTTITFDPSLSGATLHLGYTLVLTKDITIDGSSLVTPITISGDTDKDGVGDLSVFQITEGVTVTLKNINITKGVDSFGGIFNMGTLTVINSTISDCVGDYRGGIYNSGGLLTIVNSTISNNRATDPDGWGGGITNDGTLIVMNSTFSGNTAGYGGGGYCCSGHTDGDKQHFLRQQCKTRRRHFWRRCCLADGDEQHLFWQCR